MEQETMDWKTKVRNDYKDIISISMIEETIKYWEKILDSELQKQRVADVKKIEELDKSYLIQTGEEADERIKISLESRKLTIKAVLSALKN